MIERPDEKAVESEVKRDQQFRSNVGKGISTVGAIGTGFATARIIPFLSKMIPVDLAMKGLSKISPKVADFLKRGQSMGLQVEEGLDYLRNAIGSKEEKEEEPANQDKNIIQQYSPELYQFMEDEIKNGRSPIEAAALAQLGAGSRKFSSIITKMTKDHKADWSSIVDSVFGSQMGKKSAMSKEEATKEAIKKFSGNKKSFVDQEMNRFEQSYGNKTPNPQEQQGKQSGQTQQGGQPGPGQQALMEILQKINQKLGQ